MFRPLFNVQNMFGKMPPLYYLFEKNVGYIFVADFAACGECREGHWAKAR
jgi:hypothetical protein